MNTTLKEIYRRLRPLQEVLLDTLWPARCAGCDALLLAPEAVFCASCETSLEAIPERCGRCGCPGHAPMCSRCEATSPPYTKAQAPFLYGGQLAWAIQRLKYQQGTYLARPLSELLTDLLPAPSSVDLIVPVPLHPRRLVHRGFNHAALLAARVAHMLAVSWSTRVLQRTRDTRSQAGLSRARRLRNVEGAFQARSRVAHDKRLLLVDDVFTTGATATACCHALLEAGAHSVEVLTLARA